VALTRFAQQTLSLGGLNDPVNDYAVDYTSNYNAGVQPFERKHSGQ